MVDAVGRSLTNKPKWYRYGKSNSGFVLHYDDNNIFVVDCPSATSLYNCVSSVALLGTNLLQSHIDVLKKYNKVVVDKDATIKAVSYLEDFTVCELYCSFLNQRFKT